MLKIYFNTFHNLAVIIDEKARTITTKKYSDVDLKGCAFYSSKAKRLKEVFRFYRNSGFARA